MLDNIISPASPARLAAILPGLLLSFGIALSAVWVRDVSGIAALNPVAAALLLGVALGTLSGHPAALKPGIAFSVRPLLRAAIVLLGLQVTLGALVSDGLGVLALAVTVVVLTLTFTIRLGRSLGVDPPLAQLIGMGTAICGASAIVAANQVVRGRDEDVTYALATITLCGTVALILYPALMPMTGLNARAYGIWAGASIHEVVQAIGAAAAGGEEAARSGTVAKLARVFLLAPAVMALGVWIGRSPGKDKPIRVAVPWFAFGFLALVALNSLGLVPGVMVQASRGAVPIMLAASVAALGLSTDLRALRARGGAPLLLGVTSTAFIAILAWAGALLLL
ncbi:MAG TPA: putative sulfate exporter family transporter [Falsiroseomonas sp.]|nr:putative sulfate exporter family transporter [Falsiroseomonas sp.]